MKNRVMKILMILIIIISVLGVIGFSYAYFSTEVKGEGKNIVLETGDLKLRYTDDSSMSLNNALPGDSIVRTFKVENIGSKKVSYNILWNNFGGQKDEKDKNCLYARTRDKRPESC